MSWLPRLLNTLYTLLYYPLAWAYDAVAWVVSLGHWKAWVASVAPHLSGPRILELGHGPGHLQAQLASQHPLVVGLDLSPPMGRLARRRLAANGYRPRLVRAQAQHLPFAAASFDQVVATFPSEYILHPDTLHAIQRVLQPQGQLLVLPTASLQCQPRHGTPGFAARLQAAGFSVQQQLLPVGTTQAVLLTARKPPQST